MRTWFPGSSTRCVSLVVFAGFIHTSYAFGTDPSCTSGFSMDSAWGGAGATIMDPEVDPGVGAAVVNIQR